MTRWRCFDDIKFLLMEVVGVDVVGGSGWLWMMKERWSEVGERSTYGPGGVLPAAGSTCCEILARFWSEQDKLESSAGTSKNQKANIACARPPLQTRYASCCPNRM